MRCRGRVLSFEVTVQQDDTVDSIAAKLGLPREVLLSANGGPSCAVSALSSHGQKIPAAGTHQRRCLRLLCLSKPIA